MRSLNALTFITLLLWVATNAPAEKLYTSRDVNGNLVFSDRPVEGSKILSVQRIEVSKGPCATVVKQGSDDDLVLRGTNNCFGPVEIEFILDKSQNISSDRQRSFSVTIPSRKSKNIIHLWRTNPRQGMSYTFTHSIIVGDPNARHDPEMPYLLPISPNFEYHFSQAFHGTSTHTHPQSEYAVDIPMPEGTPIYAARNGVIMDIANDYFTGGKGAAYEQKANFIRILHDDGTMGRSSGDTILNSAEVINGDCHRKHKGSLPMCRSLKYFVTLSLTVSLFWACTADNCSAADPVSFKTAYGAMEFTFPPNYSGDTIPN
jgi:Domain of unknown function (DUF4124)